MTDGIYALVNLDGSAPDTADLIALGLNQPEDPYIRRAPGITVRCIDRQFPSIAVNFLQTGDELVAFLGYLDEPEQLAGVLGLDLSSPPAVLARAAVERYGQDAPKHLLGEWSMLRWNIHDKLLTLHSSEFLRDPIFFASDANRVAVAPQVLRLTQLSWIGREIDPVQFALILGRARIRHARTHETIWRRISRALPSATEMFGEGMRSTTMPSPELEPMLWRGSFEDAVDAVDALGRRIVQQYLQRNRRTAIFLSGGLDSSLLAAWGGLVGGQDAELFCLTSVAPPDSGLADELSFSRAVAERFGLELQDVFPPADWDIYRPPTGAFAFAGTPIVGVRHYLYRALYEAAQSGRATGVLDGVGGELSLTDRTALPLPYFSPRARLRAFREWRQTQKDNSGWPRTAFHARFSEKFLKEIPPGLKEAWTAKRKNLQTSGQSTPSGFHPTAMKKAEVETSTELGLRHGLPFRDMRLLRLFAKFPASFKTQGGVTRALARAILKDKVPDSVRLRQQGLPFSPDYETRLMRQAKQAYSRMDIFRELGLKEWLDLDSISFDLLKLSDGQSLPISTQFEVQITVLAAEFLCWMRAADAEHPQ